MIQDVLARSGSTIWTSVILVAMFLLFTAIAVSIYRGARNRFARESRLPLDDESSHAAEANGTQS